MNPRPLILAAALSLPLPAHADDDCFAAMRDWIDADAAVSQIEAAWNITVDRLKVDDGCYEVQTRDAAGSRVEVKFDPATLHAVSLKIRFENPEEAGRYMSLLGSAAAAGD